MLLDPLCCQPEETPDMKVTVCSQLPWTSPTVSHLEGKGCSMQLSLYKPNWWAMWVGDSMLPPNDVAGCFQFIFLEQPKEFLTEIHTIKSFKQMVLVEH